MSAAHYMHNTAVSRDTCCRSVLVAVVGVVVVAAVDAGRATANNDEFSSREIRITTEPFFGNWIMRLGEKFTRK